MLCPGCGLYNPSERRLCVSCGTRLTALPTSELPTLASNSFVPEDDFSAVKTTERPQIRPPHTPDELTYWESQHELQAKKPAIPTVVGIALTVGILAISAAISIFIFSRSTGDIRLFDKGERELANGQFAFAVKTLEQATARNPKDARIFLALARAYVGIDQIDKAWDCIGQAQQLGTSLVAEPTLASDLANYYRQRGEYEKAIDLLRPLAKADVSGKKAELADLDALWGDEALRDGKIELALRCWEEVKDLHDGSRFGEAESRLTTIYQKLATTLASSNDDAKALDYLSKLNSIAQNAHNYEMAAEIYERDGQLELAVDQMRQAIKLDSTNSVLTGKLASLLQRRGKELLDQGNTDSGYAYLQQAKEVDPKIELPDMALRSLNVGFEGREPKLSGEVWNAGQKAVSNLDMKVELWDQVNSKILWSEDRHIIDEYEPPLDLHQSKSFEFVATVPVKSDGSSAFRVFLNGSLYKLYPIGRKQNKDDTADGANTIPENKKDNASAMPRDKANIPPIAPNYRYEPMPPRVNSDATTAPVNGDQQDKGTKGPSSEEKTMKDLDL